MRRFPIVLLLAALLVGVAACAGSGTDGTEATTSIPYVVNPVEPGHGFVQLGGTRYPFDGVICATGRLKSDPAGSDRTFGVYANFKIDGTLYAVSLTRYHYRPAEADPADLNTPPTIKDMALIRAQGKGEVIGLQARRETPEAKINWIDPRDAQAKGPLIEREGNNYSASGIFGPDDVTGVSKDFKQGSIAAQCPDPATTTTATTASTAGTEGTTTGTMK